MEGIGRQATNFGVAAAFSSSCDKIKPVAETLKLQAPSVGQWAPAVALAWLIPGGGHFLLKRPGRGAVLSISVILVFLLGLILAAIFLRQHYPSLVRPMGDNLVPQIADGFPRLPYFLWILVLGAVLYVYRGLTQVRNRLSEKEKTE